MEDVTRLLALGEQALEKGAFKAAQTQLQRALGLDAESVEVRLCLAEALAGQHLFADAIELLRQGVELLPGNSEFLFALGDLEFEAHQPDAAAATYRTILDLDPADSDAWVSLGLVHYHQEKFDEAIRCYRQALEHDPEAVFALNALGDALFSQGDLDGARECFEKGVALDPEDPQADYNLAELHYDNGDLEAAEAGCRNAIAKDPTFSNAYLTLGNIHLDLEKPSEALSAFLGFLRHENSPGAETIRAEVEAVVAGLRDELKSGKQK